MPRSPNDPRFHFEANPSLEELITQQGKAPVADIRTLRGGWPEEEAVEDFIATMREWREHSSSVAILGKKLSAGRLRPLGYNAKKPT